MKLASVQLCFQLRFEVLGHPFDTVEKQPTSCGRMPSILPGFCQFFSVLLSP